MWWLLSLKGSFGCYPDMTVVEVYVRRKKITSPEDSSQFNMVVSSLIHEGIAPNTSGSVSLAKPNSKVLVHWRGAAEIVLASCATYLDSNGSQQSIENEYFYLAVYVL